MTPSRSGSAAQPRDLGTRVGPRAVAAEQHLLGAVGVHDLDEVGIGQVPEGVGGVEVDVAAHEHLGDVVPDPVPAEMGEHDP